MTVHYEWVIETLEGPDDDEVEIVDVDHADTYAEAADRAARCAFARIALVRDAEAAGGFDRAWAYVEQGRLPEWLEDAFGRRAAKVPSRYRAQFERAL
jgi:hypothetical protein